MKKIEIEVVSKEIVHPSSPTPDRLHSYQLSFLDQFQASVYNPLILFYPDLCDTEANKIKISDQLKQSISEALTYYYPLAGRITSNNLFVDCNDEGIPFLEAQVKCQLSDVINNPVPSELTKLLPFHVKTLEEFPMGIQLNIFECGGIGVGVCTTHKIIDALSFMRFVNFWAAIARGDKNLVAPQFGAAEIFPPRDLGGFDVNIIFNSVLAPNETIITKRFVFTASKIGEIREKYSDKTSLENPIRPTRIEALSAFMWNRFAAATKVSPDTLCTINHMINLRTRIEPPLPEHSVGNLYSWAMTVPSMDNVGELGCHNLISEIRESIRKIDKEFVKRLQDGYSPLNDVIENFANLDAKREMLSLTFTSLCRFPRYEADFGWGKPIWASSCARDMKNVVSFMDTATGDGVEAWMSLNEEDMAKLESDKEFLAYISPKSF